MDAQGPETAVELMAVTAGYGTGAPVLTDVSVRLEGPGLVHVRGSNGCGKSTLLELVSGHLRPWSGTVSVGGRPPRNGRARNVAVARTEPAFFPTLTLRDHCHLFSRGTGTPLSALARAVSDLRLDGHLDQYPRQLSTGTRKKFWFVLHVCQQAAVLGFDEPFNAVDQESRQWMLEQLERKAGTSLVVVVTHEVPDGWVAQHEQPLFGEASAASIRTRSLQPVGADR